MSQVAIITDSCASLPDDFYGKYGIVSVPYYVNIGAQSYRDLVDITREEFVDHMRRATELPKSANPGAGDYLEAFRSVLEAARAAKAGATLDDIVALVQRMIPVTRMLQTADTLKYLYMGGRIGRALHLVGSLVNIKPIISMEDGEILALGRERSRSRAYRRMTELMTEHVGPRGRIKAAVIHAADEEAAAILRDMVAESFECLELLTAELSTALTVHTGPGTVGVCYFPVKVLGQSH
jgi:fatty acid-binding protein DegV